MRTAFKVRAYPDTAQQQVLSRTFGCVRLVWNKTLAERQHRYTTERRSTSYAETSRALPIWKADPDLAFLSEVAAVPLQQVLRHQHTAFKNFFAGRSRYPRFKSRHGRQSATYTRAGFRMKGDELWLAKMDSPLRVVWTWPDIDLASLDPFTVTVSRDPDNRWFVSFSADVPDPDPLLGGKGEVGVDVGIRHFATLSTGEKIPNPAYLSAAERKLIRAQRALSRKVKGSSNRHKQRVRVARAHSRVSDARRDFLHKTSTRLVREFDTIAIEDLAVKNMVRNHRLAKSINDAGWGVFRQFLEYKAERAGRQIKVAPRFYPSSKTCSECGHLLSELSLGTRHWTCPDCGTLHDRDINAAKNIAVAAGLVET